MAMQKMHKKVIDDCIQFEAIGSQWAYNIYYVVAISLYGSSYTYLSYTYTGCTIILWLIPQ